MRLLLAVCVVTTLCVGCAHGGILDRLRNVGTNALYQDDNNVVETTTNNGDKNNAGGGEGGNPGGNPQDEPPMVLPVDDIKPADQQQLSFKPSDEKYDCKSYTGGWHWSSPFNCDPVTTPNGNTVYYFNCKAWTPKWSGCRGNCGDSTEVMSAGLGVNSFFKRHCQCCTGNIAYLIKPSLYCYKLEISWNPFYIIYQGYTWKAAMDSSHNWALIGGCDCRICTSVAYFKKRIETSVKLQTDVMDEDQVAISGRKNPSHDDDQNQMDDVRQSMSDISELSSHMDEINSGMRA